MRFAAQPASQPSVEEAAALFSDLPALWSEATNAERQRPLAPLIDRVYVDVETRRIAAITPHRHSACFWRVLLHARDTPPAW